MNADRRFLLHPDAAQDITEIYDFIAEDNPIAARNTREEIFKTITSLLVFPNKGLRRPDLTSKPLRFQIVGNHVIAYAPDDDPLLIIAVLDTRRNPRVLAAILRDRQ